MYMEKNILLEVHRVRELMGLKLIKESVSNPRWLGEILSKVFGDINNVGVRNIDPGKLREAIENTLRKTNPNVGDSVITGIQNAIRQADFDNPILSQLNMGVFLKNLILSGDPSIKSEIKNSVKKSLSAVYPEMGNTSREIENLINNMSPAIAQLDAEKYNGALELLQNYKKKIQNLEGIDKQYINLLLDSFGLNNLPKNAELSELEITNANSLRDTISEMFTTNFTTERGSNNIISNGVTFTQREFQELQKFAEGKMGFDNLSTSLQNKILPALKKNQGFIDDYLNNIIKKLGYQTLQGTAEIDEFTNSVMNQVTRSTSWEDILKNDLTDFDFNLLDAKLKSLFGNLSILTQVAARAKEYPNKTIGEKIAKVFYEKIYPNYKQLMGLDLMPGPKYFYEVFWQNLKSQTKYGSADEVKKLLENELVEAAKRAKNNIDITGNLSTIRNYIVALNSSDFSEKAAREWVDKNLQAAGMLSSRPEYQELINSTEFKEFIETLGTGIKKNTKRYFSEFIRPYLEMILINPKRLKQIFNEKEWTKKFGAVGLIFGDAIANWARYAAIGDPSSIETMRKIYALAGKRGIWVDRAIKYLAFNTFIFPYVSSLLFGSLQRQSQLDTIAEIQNIQKLICQEVKVNNETLPKIGTDDECNELQITIDELNRGIDRSALEDAFQSKNPLNVILIQSHLDELYEITKIIEDVMLKKGGYKEVGQSLYEWLGGLNKQMAQKKGDYEKKLKEEYCYEAKNGKSAEANMLDCLMKKRMEKRGEKQIEKQKYTDDDPGFKKWADDNGFETVGVYNKDEGKGFVKLPFAQDSTAVPRFWNDESKIFEP